MLTCGTARADTLYEHENRRTDMKASREHPRQRALRTVAAVILVSALCLTVAACGAKTAVEPSTLTSATGSLGDTASTTQPDSHALSTDPLPAIVVDSPTPGATVQSPVRVTGTVVGGATVTVSLLIISDDGSVVAKWEEAFYDTGTRVTFDQSLQYAPASAARAARILITASAASAGGQVGTSTYVVPITLE
jgi:hypothetical protein